MSSESERRNRDREIESDNAANEWPRGGPEDRPDDQKSGKPAERDGSLRQRLSSLQAPASPAGPVFDPPPDLDLPQTPPRSRARKSMLGGLLVGFGASLAVGLLLAGGLKWDDLLAALRSPPSSSVDLYPPRDIGRRDTGKADRGDGPRKTTQTDTDRPKHAAAGYIANLNVGVPCDGVLTETRPGFLQLQLTDPSRRGSSVIVKIDGLDHRATFGADGRLLLLAPKLFGSGTARWALTDGTQCSKTTAPPTDEHSKLRVALVWGGPASLTLHIVEPSAWLGGPAGDISAHTPNLDHTRGAGELHTFGQPADPTRIQLYIAETARLGATGVLSAVVSLEPSPDGGCSKTGAAATVRYQLYTLRTDRGVSARPEVRSLAFELPPCDRATATPRPVERIPIKF